MLAFVERVGTVLLQPQVAYGRAQEQRYLNDSVRLLVLKLICFETPALFSAVWSAGSIGLGVALAELSTSLARQVSKDIILLFGAGLLITLFAGSRRNMSRDFELGTAAWLPYFAVQVAATVGTALFAWGKAPLVWAGWVAFGLYGARLVHIVRWVRRSPGPST